MNPNNPFPPGSADYQQVEILRHIELDRLLDKHGGRTKPRRRRPPAVNLHRLIAEAVERDNR